MGHQLNDKDVDRIASRVVEKLVWYAVLIVAAIIVLPALFVTVQYASLTITRGMPAVVTAAVAALFVAVPAVAVWVWSRRTR